MRICCINFLAKWFLPSFAHYFKNLTTALGSIRINLKSVWQNLTFNVQNIWWSSIFLSPAILLRIRGWVLFMYINILTVWFWSSFAHYCKKPTTVLDSIRINSNCDCENFPFNVQNILWSIFLSHIILLPIRCWFGSVHKHRNCMILTTALDSIRINLKSFWENFTFNVQNIYKVWYFLRMQFSCPCRLGVVLCMHILTLWFLPSFAYYFKKLTTALDSIRINLKSFWENFTFNVQNIWWSSIFLSHAILLPIRSGDKRSNRQAARQEERNVTLAKIILECYDYLPGTIIILSIPMCVLADCCLWTAENDFVVDVIRWKYGNLSAVLHRRGGWVLQFEKTASILNKLKWLQVAVV